MPTLINPYYVQMQRAINWLHVKMDGIKRLASLSAPSRVPGVFCKPKDSIFGCLVPAGMNNFSAASETTTKSVFRYYCYFLFIYFISFFSLLFKSVWVAWCWMAPRRGEWWVIPPAGLWGQTLTRFPWVISSTEPQTLLIILIIPSNQLLCWSQTLSPCPVPGFPTPQRGPWRDWE